MGNDNSIQTIQNNIHFRRETTNPCGRLSLKCKIEKISMRVQIFGYRIHYQILEPRLTSAIDLIMDRLQAFKHA